MANLTALRYLHQSPEEWFGSIRMIDETFEPYRRGYGVLLSISFIPHIPMPLDGIYQNPQEPPEGQ